MKKQKVQKELDKKEEDNKKKGFDKDFKQVQYKRSLKNLRRNILFLINGVTLRKN